MKLFTMLSNQIYTIFNLQSWRHKCKIYVIQSYLWKKLSLVFLNLSLVYISLLKHLNMHIKKQYLMFHKITCSSDSISYLNPELHLRPVVTVICCKNISNMNLLKNRIQFYYPSRRQIELTRGLSLQVHWKS